MKAGPGRPKKDTTPAQRRKLYSEVFAVLFAIPAYGGLGAHWQISEEEGRELAERFDEAAQGFPDSKFEAVVKVLEKWMPVTMFGVTLATMIYSRWTISGELRREHLSQEHARASDRGQGPHRTADDGAPAGGGSGKRPGAAPGSAAGLGQKLGIRSAG